LVEEALDECSDQPPPLCLLQALVLITFQQLIRGVRGYAWRQLGVCIRIAYELQLHLVDSDEVGQLCTTPESDISEWCCEEERRRLWWAIWEMDTFASTIRRLPTAIDWSQIETHLPVSDDHWFTYQFKASCFLEKKPMNRRKALQKCENSCPKAWFIVTYSFMRDAQMLPNLPGGFGLLETERRVPSGSEKTLTQKLVHDVPEQAIILANALQCFTQALPEALRYREEYLSFTSKDPATAKAVRQLHSSKCSIHLTIQLSKFMIYHYDAFGGAGEDLHLIDTTTGAHAYSLTKGRLEECVRLCHGPTRKGLDHYIEAAEDVLMIVTRSSDTSVRHLNPFLANTIWLAAAVFLSYRIFAPVGISEDLIESKVEVLRMNLGQYTKFWNIPSVLQRNLDFIEDRLEQFRLLRGTAGKEAQFRNSKGKSTKQGQVVEKI
jgi:hypothetical protein